MQVIIEEVVSRVRAVSSGSAMSPETLSTIVAAVLQAIEAKERRCKNVAEELSLENYQQRTPHGS